MPKSSRSSDRVTQLQALIAYHQKKYHEDDAPEISDEAYDALVHELAVLIGVDITDSDSVSNTDSVLAVVEGAPSEAFQKVEHVVRQWSFDKVFSDQELVLWYERVTKLLEKAGVNTTSLPVVAEHKIDGLKLVIEYRSGRLYRASTRGDGRVGEDVTHTARTIAVLPHTLSLPVDLICVGEVWLARDEFNRINAEQSVNGAPLFANPRNAAAGTLRQLNPAIAAARKLSLTVYDIDRFDGQATKTAVPRTQFEELSLLHTLGLPISQDTKHCLSIEAVRTFYTTWQKERKKLPYGIDGIVLKLDDVHLQHVLGYTAKAPRFGIAYKFPAVETTTIVTGIVLQVGRTGVVTPVAELTPVLIDGSMMSRATLHNEDRINELDVRVGDTVVVRKAGDIIPEIVQVMHALRPPRTRAYCFPDRVAECGGDGRIERIVGSAAYRCVSLESDVIQRQKLYYFVSKAALNIDGVGPKLLDRLLDAGMIRTAADLFSLTKAALLTLPGVKDRSAANIIAAIKAAQTQPLDRLLIALSIDGVGAEVARLLAERFKTVPALRAATIDEIRAIHGIGDIIAAEVVAWFAHADNQTLLSELTSVITVRPPTSEAVSLALQGVTIVFTGTLPSLSREEAAARAREYGARVGNTVTKQTTYVVAGAGGGSKRTQAEALGVPVIDEATFLALVAKAG